MEDILTKLGKPFYQRDGCLIYNMDCVEGMKRLKKHSIDLCITSPPYNIGKEYEEVKDLNDYIDWCKSWLAEIARIINPSGAFWLNLGYVHIEQRANAIPLPYLLWDKVPMYLMQEIVWNYGAGVACKKYLSPRNEKWLWYIKDRVHYTFNLDEIRDPNVKYPNQKKNGKLRCNTLGKNPSDVWQIAKVTSGTNRSSKERTSHPAQFPIDLIERIVKGCSNPNDLIVDPFMGSGSTAEASLKLGRKVIGFEIREDYCQVIASRIDGFLEELDSAAAQAVLF